MNALFGDATTAMPTPATQAESASLMGIGSPVPSLDIRRGPPGQFNAESAIPGLDIDPPHVNVHNGKPQIGNDNRSEGIGGWISRMVGKGQKGEGEEYSRLGQDEP